jgi:hydrogenase expression/formation protein HypE
VAIDASARGNAEATAHAHAWPAQQVALDQDADVGVLVAEALGAVGDGSAGESGALAGLAVTTRVFTADPPFFDNGDIGRLAVCGAVNDLAATGAEPRQLALGIVLEAGLPLRLLHRLTDSLRDAAREAGVTVAAVDARVVRAGEADRVLVTATALGTRRYPALRPAALRPGDRILVTAPLGDHAAHLMSLRGALGYERLVPTDCAPLAGLLAGLVPRLRYARPVTAGGLAAVLRTCAAASGLALRVDEPALPVREETRAVLAALGLDPLDAACAGALCLFVPPDAADGVLQTLRAHAYGGDSVAVGEVLADGPGTGTGAGAGTVQLAGTDGASRPLLPPADPPAARLR